MSNTTHDKHEFSPSEIKQIIAKPSTGDSSELLSIFDKVATAIRAKHL